MPYSLMAKPVGPLCNLNCTYCYYLEKAALYKPCSAPIMSSTVLEAYVKQMFLSPGSGPVEFSWQGGEPLLAGIEFFEHAFALQEKYARGRKFSNTIQTNGTLLTDVWCDFFVKNSVLMGISLDGPAFLHDHYRVDSKGQGTFEKVLQAIALLHKHGIDFNLLATINRKNADHPLEVYTLLKEVGQGFIQFIPLVGRKAGVHARKMGLSLEPPPQANIGEGTNTQITEWSVSPEQFGDFYITIFDAWLAHDVGKVFVQLFDATLAGFLNAPSPVCYYSGYCGGAGLLERNGDVYACDHYVYPQFKRGNILKTPLRDMLESVEQRRFGEEKQAGLPEFCRQCAYVFACNGECPKNRFAFSPGSKSGESNVNYLCAGYKRFFNHAAPGMQRMAKLIGNGKTADEIMK